MSPPARSIDDETRSGGSQRLWRWTKFECHAEPGSVVFIAGTFNNWKPSGLHKLMDGNRDGTFGTLLKLRLGRHEYRFLVNGVWRSERDDPARNSVVNVA
jgi:1,4-alpha-glucan branching enzyme